MAEFHLIQQNLQQFVQSGGHKSLPNCKLAAFSPPYKAKDGYSDSLIHYTGELVRAVLEPGGWVFFNFGQLSEDFGRPHQAFQEFLRGANTSPGLGFQLQQHQTIIWVKSYSPGPGEPCKGHCQPLNSPNLLNYSWEYIFTACIPRADGSLPELDRLAIGVPFADEGNLSRGNRGKNGNLRCAGDVWVIPYETTGGSKKKSHVYEWPAALVERILKVSRLKPGDWVIDPFIGAGQTAVVAQQFGINAIGIEQDASRASVARGRWGT